MSKFKLNDFLNSIISSFSKPSLTRNFKAQQHIQVHRPSLIILKDKDREVNIDVFALKEDKIPSFTRRVHRERPLYVDFPCYIRLSKNDHEVDVEVFFLSTVDFEKIEEQKRSHI